MQRVTVTLDEELVSKVEERFGDRRYLNFSAVVRELMNKGLEARA
jgi:Arc/MetJ-type ribon-helix-helix transcriptional regulator